MILRCTKKLLAVIRPQQLADRPPEGEDWYANLLWFSGRKCLLLTHAATLFTIFEPDVRAPGLRDPSLPGGSGDDARRHGRARHDRRHSGPGSW